MKVVKKELRPMGIYSIQGFYIMKLQMKFKTRSSSKAEKKTFKNVRAFKISKQPEGTSDVNIF